MTQHILAVDDEPHILKLLARIVEDKTPYDITTTSNSMEVPGLLQERLFDVVVTDLRMPGLDGMDIVRAVRAGGRGEQVILITAFGSLESAMEALSEGVSDYINKPFKKEEFLFSLHRAMSCHRTLREAARLDEIFHREPYELARDAFDREYVRRLRERAPEDVHLMAERCGLDPIRIEELMRS